MMKWNLRSKILVSVGLTILLAQVLSTIVQIYGLRQSYQKALNLRFEALVQGIVADIVDRDSRMWPEPSQRDPEMLHTILQAASMTTVPQLYEMNKEKGVAFISVVSPEAVLATHSVQEEWNTPVQSEKLRHVLQQQTQITILDGDMYHTIVPVLAKDAKRLERISTSSNIA